jgi:hypothetical protein
LSSLSVLSVVKVAHNVCISANIRYSENEKQFSQTPLSKEIIQKEAISIK